MEAIKAAGRRSREHRGTLRTGKARGMESIGKAQGHGGGQRMYRKKGSDKGSTEAIEGTQRHGEDWKSTEARLGCEARRH